MKLTAKTRYGIRTMIEIGMNDGPIFQKDIAKKQELTEKFLDQIIAGLKKANLIQNSAGKKSGYILSHPSDEITAYDIYNALEPSVHVIGCLCDNEYCTKDDCASKGLWAGLNEQIKEYMESKNLSSLIAQQKEFNKKA